MERDEIVLRHGIYCGIASRLLSDNSYAARVFGHVEDFSSEDLLRDQQRMRDRLIASGYLRANEDAETMLEHIEARTHKAEDKGSAEKSANPK